MKSVAVKRISYLKCPKSCVSISDRSSKPFGKSVTAGSYQLPVLHFGDKLRGNGRIEK
ncbi:hypothetical protein D3C80_2083890 [compost metagenome]